jgi:hypothetical protein
MTHLTPCPGCDRHIRVSTDRCPFCGDEVDLSHVPPPRLPQTRLNRAALFAFGTTMAAGLLGAGTGCGGESTSDPETAGGAPGSGGYASTGGIYGLPGSGGYAASGGAIYGLPGVDSGSSGSTGGWYDAGIAGAYGLAPDGSPGGAAGGGAFAGAGGSAGAIDSGTVDDDGGNTAGAAGLYGAAPDDGG